MPRQPRLWLCCPVHTLLLRRCCCTHADVDCCCHLRAACAGLQVREITRSLKEREARAREAEEVAAAHLQREKRLIQAESDLLQREQAVERERGEAATSRSKLEAAWAGQRQEAARLAEAGRALEAQQAEAAEALGGREAALAAREEELAAAMQEFEREREAQAEADEEQRQRTLAELRRLDEGIGEAMGQLRQAEEEAAEMRRRVQEVQREGAEAEAARDKALLAHTAAQQVGRGWLRGGAWFTYRIRVRITSRAPCIHQQGPA